MAAALWVVLAAVYSFSVDLRATRNAAITGDEPFYLLTTQSLLDDGNLDLREQYERESWLVFFDHPDGLWKQSVPGRDGKVLSPHEPGLSVLLMPGFSAGGLRGAQLQLVALAAAAFALGFVLVARESGRSWLAFAATGAVGLTAPAFVYSSEVYPEVPAGLALVVALLLWRRSRGAVRAVGLAVALSALAWLGMKYVPLGLVVAAAYLATAGERRERAGFVAMAAGSAVAYGWLHLHWFGALTAYNSNTVYEGAATSAVLESHVAFEGRVYRLWGLFVDQRFGIGRWAPVLLAVLPALPLLFSREWRRNGVGPVVAALVGVQVLVATFVAVTMMGWWFPGRMLMVVFPLLPFVLVAAWQKAPAWLRAVGAGAAAYSVLITVVLYRAASGGEVTLAVDPFALRSEVFRLPGALFPDYRIWTRETILLSAAWVLALGVCAVGAVWSVVDWRSLRGARWPGWSTASGWPRTKEVPGE